MRYWNVRNPRMSTHLDKLIENVRSELARERERVGNVVISTKKRQKQETGSLKRLEQRLLVLLQVRSKESHR
jgi:hypothetical protein